MTTQSIHTKYENFIYVLVKGVLNFTFCFENLTRLSVLVSHSHFPELEKSEFTRQRDSRGNFVTNLISRDCAKLDHSILRFDNLAEYICCHGWKWRNFSVAIFFFGNFQMLLKDS